MLTRKMVVCFVAAFAALWAGTAMAGTIAVSNASFQDIEIAEDGGIGFFDPWGPWYSEGVSIVPAAFNPSAEYYSTAAGTGTPTGADGSQVFLLNASGAAGQAVIFQDTAATIEAGQTYTLSAAFGKRLGSWTTRAAADHYEMYLKDAVSGVTLASYAIAGSSLTADTFTDVSCSYTVNPGDASIGHAMRIILGVTTDSGSNQYADFDNVRLTATPEPATLIMVLTGVLGLLAYAWRKRR